MTKEQALQTIVNAINQASFTGTLAEISTLGGQCQEAIGLLAEAIKPDSV